MSADHASGEDSYPESLDERIDIICDRFEAAWAGNRRPSIEGYLDDCDASRRLRLLLELLLVELQYRQKSGESVVLKEYERRFPEQISAVRRAFCTVDTTPSKASKSAASTDPSSLGVAPADGATGHGPDDWQSTVEQDPLRGKIDRYQVHALLGRGGFGSVYLAFDNQLQRQVAIKVPRQDRIYETADVEAFLAEARVLASLDHRHIVPVHDVGRTEDGRCFVVSKFIEGDNLCSLIAAGRLTHFESAQIVATVAKALHYVHRRGIIHRDIKPANILVDAAGTPYVADFGLALL